LGTYTPALNKVLSHFQELTKINTETTIDTTVN
jgi:hypothetical protein